MLCEATYFYNTNHRKFVDGFNPAADTLAIVGTIVVEGDTMFGAAEAAFAGFNRIDAPVPVLDAAEAPSMSVGDVLHLDPRDPDTPPAWMVVKSFGFEEIDEPHGTKARKFTRSLVY